MVSERDIAFKEERYTLLVYSVEVHKQVVKVTIFIANDVTYQTHDSSRVTVGLSDIPPLRGTRISTPQLPKEERKR